MGSYNILFTEVTCPNCGAKFKVQIQYKYGNTWQLHYKVGDTITWGGNDKGRPGLTKVKVYGIAESITCSDCGKNSIPEEYDVFINNDVITSIAPMNNIDDYIAAGKSYVILE